MPNQARTRAQARRSAELAKVVCAELQEHKPEPGSEYHDNAGTLVETSYGPRFIGFQREEFAPKPG